MDEKQLVKQLKTLRQFKPNKQWATATKNDILGESHTREEVFDWVNLHKPSFLVGAVVVAAVMLVVFFGFNGQPIDNELLSLGASLEQLELNLEQVSGRLIEIALADVQADPEKVLEVRETVRATIEEGEEFVAKAKKRAKNLEGGKKAEEVLAALANVEQTLETIKETTEQSEKQAAERELSELKNMILNERQQELLEFAEERFLAGDYSQALLTIIEISQN